MSHDHDDFQTEPVRGLPEVLPEGEHILWQGQPNWWSLAQESLSLRWVAGYFVFLFAWRTIGGSATRPWLDAASDASFFLVLGLIVCALLMLVSLIQAKATCYTITNKRVAMRIGAALTMTLNLPFKQVQNANLALRKSGHGSIALEMNPEGGMGFSYVLTWPHVRPWKLKDPQPSLRCIPDARAVAAILAEAAQTAVSVPDIQITRAPEMAAETAKVVAAE